MAEKDKLFSSKIKHTGIFTFKDFYKFCYAWLSDEIGLDMAEKKYSEKIAGDSKIVELTWEGDKKLTDYFRFDIQVKMKADKLKNIQVTQGGAKIDTNQGVIEMEVKGTLVRDYEGKFERTGTQKFMRSIYEKWVIPSRIDEFKTKIITDCDEFLGQAKAWLDLEGKR